MSTLHHHDTRSLRVPLLITLFVCMASLLVLVSGAGTSPTAAAITPETQREHAPDLNTRDTATIRIMTWNIRYDNPDDGIHAWPRRRDELLTFVLSKDPDILCIQEGLQSQVEFLKDGMAGFDRRGVGRDDGKQSGEYSAIYFRSARFGCRADGTFWLSPTPSVPGKGWDAACMRIVTWAQLHDSVTKTEFYVFNTHFDHEGVQARIHSARLLRLKIGGIARNRPFVLAGDFNSTDSDSAYRILTSRDGTSPCLEDAIRRSVTPHRGPRATFTGFELKDPGQGERIDYLFVSDSVLVNGHCTCIARRPAGFLSDHLPVCADIVPR
jgi:endonuclease/exonuclease/phosphatase family metal-dependent hydrolase